MAQAVSVAVKRDAVVVAGAANGEASAEVIIWSNR
jgi:hypothetical protein